MLRGASCVLRKCCQGRRGGDHSFEWGGARGTTGAHAVGCSFRDGCCLRCRGGRQAAPSLLCVACAGEAQGRQAGAEVGWQVVAALTVGRGVAGWGCCFTVAAVV